MTELANKSHATWFFHRGQWTYLCPIFVGSKIINCLGSVKQMNDGRFRWTRFYQKNYPPKGWVNDQMQGCCKTLGMAQQQIEQGFQV